MGFQSLFKFVKCWRAPDIFRETVPSNWGGDGERALAEFQTSARDKQSAMSSWPQWRLRTDWSDGNAKFGDVRRCLARKCTTKHSLNKIRSRTTVRVASGGCLWAVVTHDHADRSCKWLWLRSSWRVAIYRSATGSIQTI